MALTCSSPTQAEIFTHNKDNVANWGRVAGQAERTAKSCPVEIHTQFQLLFALSKKKYGSAYLAEYEIGYKEINEYFGAKGSTIVCPSILEEYGPKGKQVENLLVPNTAAHAQVAASPPPQPVGLKMSAIELLKSAGNNELRLRRQVEEAKGLLLSGRVENIENGYFGSGVVVALRAGEFASVHAYLEKSELKAAEALDSGDAVTMLCQNPTNIVKGFSAAVYNCVFKQIAKR